MMNPSDIICKTNIFMFILSRIKKIRTIIDQKKHDIDEEGQLVKCHHRNLHRKSPPTFPTGLPTDLAYKKIIESLFRWLIFKLKLSFIVFKGILRYTGTKSGCKIAFMAGGYHWWRWKLCVGVWNSPICSEICSQTHKMSREPPIKSKLFYFTVYHFISVY